MFRAFSKRTPIKAKRDTPRRSEGRVQHKRIKPRTVDPTPEQERFWDSLPYWCQVPGCFGEAVNHHLMSTAPGKQGRRDHWFIARLCPDHHNMSDCSVHGLGSEAAFKRETGVDLVAIAVANRKIWR
jgi:hypothetical protein